MLSGPQEDSATDGSANTTWETSVKKRTSDTISATPKKRKPRKKKDPPSAKEQKEKKDRFLERNRKAAQKCREKKKDWVTSLSERCDNLKLENDYLNAQRIRDLEEIEKFKLLLTQHAKCGHQGINRWIQQHQGDQYNQYDQDFLRDRMIAEPYDTVSRQGSQDISLQGSTAMVRGGSSQSRTSQNSSSSVQKTDSGISNMGTPTDDRHKLKGNYEDEGLGGGVSLGPGEQYMAQEKILTSHYSRTSPLDGVDPTPLFEAMGIPLADLNESTEFYSSIDGTMPTGF
jgi:hypothetical protein